MSKFLVCATGYFFILYGLAFTFLPVEMASIVTGGSPKTPSGLIDLRATYGGMSVAMGATILILSSRAETLRAALAIVALVLLAMAGGRIVGMAFDGTPNLIMYIYLAAELLFSGLALYLLASTRSGGDA